MINALFHVIRRNCSYSALERGQLYTESYKLYFKHKNDVVSPWHDIPLRCENGLFNMVVEIPRWSNAKMEINKCNLLNPIQQDVKKEKVRFVDNIYPHRGYLMNYGAFPQTWEDPKFIDPNVGFGGDNDPLDVCDVGNPLLRMGQIVQVKPLGALALVDENEADWKIIVINSKDQNFNEINSLGDFHSKRPGLLQDIVRWFTNYKVPQGKPFNTLAFNSKLQNAEVATKVIEQAHGHWKELLNQGSEKLSLKNTSLKDSKFFIESDDTVVLRNSDPFIPIAAHFPSSVNFSFYFSESSK